mmetsp:Transcript_88382/g.189814  ORF Transcript_88382/g.189814 Transcript_88382/m.189814 type:complete len:305 (-) Transcript_88382:81-995(-)
MATKAVDFPEAAAFLAEEGLESNGSVLVYYGEHEEKGTPYALRSIAWRFLEGSGIGVVAYNTPKSLNCLAPNQVMEAFLVLEHAKRDPRVKVLVWTGTGRRAFNSGAALKGDQKVYLPAEIFEAYSKRGMAPVKGDWVMAPLTKAFWDFPKPIVLAINGLAVGGAANIALANFGDMVLCSKESRFMYPFAKLGVTPELGSSLLIPFLAGMTKAKELMMTGEWMSADEALRLNLINGICEPEELLPKALAVAAKMTTAHPETMRLIKRVMNAPLRDQLDAILAREQVTIMESIKASGGFAKNAKL